MSIMQTALLILNWIFIVAALLPFIHNDHWVFRILEYPRYQKFILSIGVLAVSLYFIPINEISFSSITLFLLFACIVYLGYKIFPYTPFQKKEMVAVPSKNTDKQIKVFTANVYQDNHDYDRMLQQIKSTDPDIIFLLETNSAWEKAMDVLLESHPNTLKAPLENTYGLLFYSRLKIDEGAVKFLVSKEIPSIEAIIELPAGDKVKIFGLHPKPPVPGEDVTSTAKDKELMKVAFKVKDCKLPVMVMGDLNDVAWSYVTELFRKNSSLLDPRRGRGFYSTFSAFSWFMRFPLDYIFCSSDFGLIEMKRLPKNGSDHFAMFSQFEYVPSLKVVHEEPVADAEEKEEAREKLTS
jgi:endonuclease/exonuclease/phosphatase (EEP) superfamily protein YafD